VVVCDRFQVEIVVFAKEATMATQAKKVFTKYKRSLTFKRDRIVKKKPKPQQ